MLFERILLFSFLFFFSFFLQSFAIAFVRVSHVKSCALRCEYLFKMKRQDEEEEEEEDEETGKKS